MESPVSIQWRATVPGKVFLLGEYAVLAGIPGIIATIPPRFSLSQRTGNAGNLDKISDESPFGRLRTWAHARGFEFPAMQFDDPYEGRGGFGASSAQFVLGFLVCARVVGIERTWQNSYRLYRELMSVNTVVPSGADVAAQASGSISYYDLAVGAAQDLSLSIRDASVLVFSATDNPARKVATHEHLAEIKSRGDLAAGSKLMRTLGNCVHRANYALEGRDIKEFAAELTRYAVSLSEVGLESEVMRADRERIRRLPGVWGCKGAGAMLSDAMVVILESPRYAPSVIEEASKTGLRLLTDRLTREPGWLEEGQVRV